jgi:hypothetical protein
MDPNLVHLTVHALRDMSRRHETAVQFNQFLNLFVFGARDIEKEDPRTDT